MTTPTLTEQLAADVRELGKWLNEEPNRPLDRQALARVLARFATAERNGTGPQFVAVAMQWAGQAHEEIMRLRAAIPQPAPDLSALMEQIGKERQAANEALEAAARERDAALAVIEALEKAPQPAPEAQQGEPVATWENKYGMKEWQVHALRAGWSPQPAQAVPLSDEQIACLYEAANTSDDAMTLLEDHTNAVAELVRTAIAEFCRINGIGLKDQTT